MVWLSDEQFELEDTLFQRLKEKGVFEFHLILGVAGTGKTQVLLSLAEDLRDSGVKVVLGVSESLKKTLTDAGFQIKSDVPSIGAVHLIDDPKELVDIKNAYHEAKSKSARALVVSIDPFQWTDAKSLMKFEAYLRPEMGHPEFISSHHTLKKFRDIVYGANPTIHWLRTVYRQSARTGSKALELSKTIFLMMNPYAHEYKKDEFTEFTSRFVDGLLVNVNFESEGGDLTVNEVENPTRMLWELISRHVARPDRWNWTDSALVVPQVIEMESKWSDYQIPIPGVSDRPGFSSDVKLGEIFEQLRIRYCLYDFPATVRGEEFQEVIVSVPTNLWAKMNRSKSGMGSPDWAEIMPLHTYITRGKDLVHLVIGNPRT